jgi:epoxyqueuosine reductase
MPSFNGKQLKELTEIIIQKALSLGFISVGFTSPARPIFFDQFQSWLKDRKNGDMTWLEKNIHLREDPSKLLEGCQTVISLAFPYASRKPATPDGFTVSRYSCPDRNDYHDMLRLLCREIAALIKGHDKECTSRVCIDSAPVLERSIACSSGMGFIGKNNMLIIPGFGSYFYLAEILTSLSLYIPPQSITGCLCGACTSCIDSCPSGALEGPFNINASRCLSYLTVEYKGGNVIPGEKMGDCFLGCDRCQEACPHNKSEYPEEVLLPSSAEILNMTDDGFNQRFGKTAFKRAGLEKIKSNIKAIKKQA